MEEATAAATLQELMSAFFRQISLMQQLLVLRGGASSKSSADLEYLDIVVRGIENQLQLIQHNLQSEAEALPKAQVLIMQFLEQERRLRQMHANLPPQLASVNQCLFSEQTASICADGPAAPKSTDLPVQKAQEKKGRSPPAPVYVTADELDSLSSYMRGRLTLEKVNGAIDEMMVFAETNAKLLATPRNKLGDDMLEKVLELRDIAGSEGVKGKHFFLECDMRGPILKLDNTGKAIVMVLRHLNRISDLRVGRQRVFVLA